MATNALKELRGKLWMPGDDPTRHPLWRDQVELEMYMQNAGAEHHRARVNRAMQHRQMSRVRPHEKLIDHWLPDIVTGLRDFLRDTKSHFRHTGGRLPASVEKLEEGDHYLIAFLALRTVVDHCVANASVMTIATRIGRAVEDAERMRLWEAQDPGLFHTVQRGLRRQGATAVHQRRVNINRFNKLMARRIKWQDWSDEERRRVGTDLIGVVCRYTDDFELVQELGESSPGSRLRKTQIRLRLADEAREWLTDAADRDALNSPQYLPTLIPPRRWSTMRQGGYYTDYVRPPELIRFKASSASQQQYARDEYDSLAMPRVYRGLHALQEVAWRVNEDVLAVARHFWDHNLASAGLPDKESLRLPMTRSRGAPDPNTAEWRSWSKTPEGKAWRKTKGGIAWRRRAAEVWHQNYEKSSKVLATERTIAIAGRFSGQTIYFPHMLDFRGRMYPIPLYLQPQGNDLARGLLTFKHGKPIEDDRGAGWLAIHVANCWGHDKVALDDRIAWTYDNEAMLLEIANDPLGHTAWAAPDHPSPWQALAATIEWARYRDHGRGYVSCLPVRVDGTCNGIQHFSAMVRDREGGAAVNLVPSDQPRDIYKDVADKLSERLKQDMTPDTEWWLELVGHDIPRSLTKRPVMILPYGGTREAYFENTRDWLKENHPEVIPKRTEPDPERWRELGKRIVAIVGPMREIVHETASSSVRVMEWLQAVAKFTTHGNQPIWWRTPSGMVVRHFYGRMKSRRIDTKIDGQRYKFTVEEPTEELDAGRQLKGIPPNFVHSLDASALNETIRLALRRGIVAMTSIHDNFGAPAADMDVAYACIREAFVETHKTDNLKAFRDVCVMMYAKHIEVAERETLPNALIRAEETIPPLLPMGDLDLDDVLASDYFFA